MTEEAAKRWREWALDSGAQGEEQRLRSIIAAASLRLARLDDSSPDVRHAREILDCAMSRKTHTWP